MAPDQYLAAQAALYGPSATEQAKGLPDIYRDPTPERCGRMAANLGGAQRAVLRLREALVREATE